MAMADDYEISIDPIVESDIDSSDDAPPVADNDANLDRDDDDYDSLD